MRGANRKVPPLLLRRRPVTGEAHGGTTAIDHDQGGMSTKKHLHLRAEVEVLGLGVVRIRRTATTRFCTGQSTAAGLFAGEG